MNTNTAYMFKHVSKAIEILVVSPEPIKGRLSHAGEHFILVPLDAVPENLKDMYREIVGYLTEFKGNPDMPWPFNSDISVTMKRRKNSTATKIAQKMWIFYHQYSDEIGINKIFQ